MNLERDLAGLFVEKDSAVSDDTVGFRVQGKFVAKAVVIIASTVLPGTAPPCGGLYGSPIRPWPEPNAGRE